MSNNDPKQVIVDYLSLPEGELVNQTDPNASAVQKDGCWRGMHHRGGGMGWKTRQTMGLCCSSPIRKCSCPYRLSY